jgi:hypothetical protein
VSLTVVIAFNFFHCTLGPDGVSIVYDVALKDMQDIEDQLLAIGTHAIQNKRRTKLSLKKSDGEFGIDTGSILECYY